MNNHLKMLRMLFCSIIFAIPLFVIPVAVAADSERHQLVGNVDVYLGIVPSQVAVEHPGMHRRNRPNRHDYHVIIALYDHKTGLRIKKATVKATVSDSALTFEEKTLDVMHIYDALSFGNFFRMSVPGQYRIKIEIYQNDTGNPVVASFVYQRPKD